MTNHDRGQGLISKYVWVIDTIYRAKRITFKELNDKWLNDDISRGMEIPKRTFNNWRDAVWDLFGIEIANENRGEFRYYISNIDDINGNGLRSWLYNTFCVSNVLANSQSVKSRILLEYVPSGQEYLQVIIESMKDNHVLNITYKSYNKTEERNFDVQPYCVKLFRQRWYLIARSTDPAYYDKGLRTYALDRVRDIQKTDITFAIPKGWDAQNYYEGCFGIYSDQQTPQQTVKLKFTNTQANYIRDLPLHESQKEIKCDDDYCIFTYNLRPTFDFQQEILRNGENVEVIEPEWLRNRIADAVKQMWNKYKEEKE